jgi:hypothetical protein
MGIQTLDPLRDPRWPELVDRHPSASFFHTRAWLETLRRTYGFEPVAYTTSPAGAKLDNAIVFCRIRSWLTGQRLVSLPFSDHAEPLTDSDEALHALLGSLASGLARDGHRYLELRSARVPVAGAAGFGESASFYSHRLDLGPSLDTIHQRLHKDCIRRKIRRAERDGLTCEEGRSDRLLEAFYRLLVLTSRRRHLPPQPLAWFRHMMAFAGDGLKIRVAFKDGCPAAAILTLTSRTSMIYKYGCSDLRFNSLGGTQLLLWHAIREAKHLRLREFDFGRSDPHTPGLVTFKDRWGATRSALRYARFPNPSARSTADDWRLRMAQRCFARMPDEVRVLAGRMLYRHVA